ncbi:hypothetical protein H1C71_027788 [Ictidomys tridecemlineatus]|nr:hypothetical protein H1C71_027788 [Ictidomys tridecemlineatus]
MAPNLTGEMSGVTVRHYFDFLCSVKLSLHSTGTIGYFTEPLVSSQCGLVQLINVWCIKRQKLKTFKKKKTQTKINQNLSILNPTEFLFINWHSVLLSLLGRCQALSWPLWLGTRCLQVA